MTPDGIVKEINAVQPWNAVSPIEFTVVGIDIAAKAKQLKNTPVPIPVSVLP